MSKDSGMFKVLLSGFLVVLLLQLHSTNGQITDCPGAPSCVSGRHCWNSYYTGETCVNGTCQCLNDPMRDRCTCLSIVGSCHIQRDASHAAATASLRGNPWPETSMYSCVADTNYNYDIHVIGNYESNGHSAFRVHNTGYTDLYLTVTGESSRPLILVLTSYEPVEWTLHIPSGVVIDKVIISSYHDNSIVYTPGQVLDVENTLRLTAYGSDAGGGRTHELLTTLYNRFGSVSSFTGTYKADEWRLTINRCNVDLNCTSTLPSGIFDQNSTPTQSSATTASIQNQCGVCPSCSTSITLASVITAILTALLATVIFVLVQIAICKSHPKIKPGGGAKAETTLTGNDEDTLQLKENDYLH